MTLDTAHPDPFEWWADDRWTEHLPQGIDSARVSKSICTLRDYYTSEWLRSAVNEPDNFLAQRLYAIRGTAATATIVALGEAVARLRDASGFSRVMGAMLAGKSTSAQFELLVADAFQQADFEVFFPKEGGGKSPDIELCRGDLSLDLECKWLNAEDWEEWESEFLLHLRIALSRSCDFRSFVADLHLNPTLSQLRMSERDRHNGGIHAELNRAFFDAMIMKITAQVQSSVDSAARVGWYGLGELGSLHLKHMANFGDTPGLQSIFGMERSGPAVFRRLLQNGILPAVSQLRTDRAGIAVIRSPRLPSNQFTSALLEAAYSGATSRFEHVVAIVLEPMQNVLNARQPARSYLNRASKFAAVTDWAELLNSVLATEISN